MNNLFYYKKNSKKRYDSISPSFIDSSTIEKIKSDLIKFDVLNPSLTIIASTNLGLL